jgi:hypothetical protein
MAVLAKDRIQETKLPAAEQERFLKVTYDEGWKDIIARNPKTGPELKKLLTRSK